MEARTVRWTCSRWEFQLLHNSCPQAVYEISEPAQEDEPNTIDLKVTPDMKPEDVVRKVLEMIS